jgi:hypothetical protein
MRSIFIHICGASKQDVEDFLSKEFSGQSRPWIYPAPPGDNSLYIDLTEPESDDLTEVDTILGKKPDVSLVADVSGRHSGRTEVLYFVRMCLNKFTGVVQDEYTNHAWTLQEIQSGYRHLGHGFFDYCGWFEEAKQKQ